MANITSNLLKKYFPREELCSLLIFSSMSFLTMLNIILKNEPLGFNDLSPMWSLRQLFRTFDMPWDYKSNLGTPNFLLGNALYNIPIIIFTFITGNTIISHKIWMLILLIISGQGFYHLFKRLFGSHVIGIIVGIYGLSNYWIIYTLFRGHNLILFAYAILPYTKSSFLKSLKEDKLMDVISTGLLTGLMLLISPHIGYIFFLFMLTYIFVDGFFSRAWKKILNHLKYSVIILCLSLIICLPMLVNAYYLGTRTYTIRMEEMSMYTIDLNRTFTSELACVIQTIIMLTTGVCILVKSKIEMLTGELKSLFYTLVILTTGGFILFSGVNHLLLTLLYRYVPGFLILREINKVMITGVYILSLVLSLIIYHLKKTFFSTVTFKPVLVSIIMGISIFYPILSGDFSRAFSTVDVPSHYESISEAWGSDTSYYRLAFLPPAVWATCYNSSNHFFLDPMVSLQEKPTLEIKSEMDTNLAACFSRWVYYSLYRKRVNQVGSLMGLTGVRYVIYRKDVHVLDERDDLRVFSTRTSREIASEAENLENNGNVGPLEIYETDSRLPHVYASDRVSLVVGDRRVLLGLLDSEGFDPVCEPPIFLDNLDDVNDVFDHVETLYIDPLRIEDLIVAFSQGKILIKVWEHLPFTADIQERWIRGEFAWYMQDGVADVAPDGYAITCSGKPLRLRIEVPEPGRYRLLAQCLLVDDHSSGGIILRIDDRNPEVISPDGVNPRGNYKWINVAGYELESGIHTLDIQPIRSLAAISKLALIPEENYEEAEESLQQKLRNKRMCYIIEDHDWSNREIHEIVEDTSFSNGFALKIKSGSIPLLIPENSPYRIQIKASGYGSVTVSIDREGEMIREKILLNTDNITKMDFEVTSLAEGWNDLKLRTEGSVLIDGVHLEPPRTRTTSSPQPDVEMVSGSKYVVRDVSTNFLVFLEAWSDGWRLRSEGEVTPSLIMMGFANIFRVPEGCVDMEIEFVGARLMSTSFKASISIIVIVILILIVREKLLD